MGMEDKIKTMYEQPLIKNNDLRARLLQKKKEKVDIYRPNERDFSDIYDSKEIEKDLAEIERLEKIWETKDTEEEKYIKEVASILEGVIADQAEQNSWLGDNCEVIPASKHDDIRNGIDAVGVFKNESEKQYLGIGVDITFSSKPDILKAKLDNIKKEIEEGHMPTLKYFQDGDTGEHKELSLPKVVIGSELQSVEKLVTLWGSKVGDRNKRLADDSMQTKIILESLYQLHFFYDFAISLEENTNNITKKEKYQEIAEAYGKMYNTLHDLYESKKDLTEKHIEKVSEDKVYQAILAYTNKE